MRRLHIRTTLLLSLLLLACERRPPVTTQTDSPPQAASPSVIEVVMRNMQFSPATVEIKKGDVVVWKNDDITPHTATSSSFGDSGSLGSGQSWRHLFTESGTLTYACTFHPEMKGVVIVK